MKPLLPCLLLPLLTSLAYGDIYKSVDADGRVTYTNIPVRGAKRVELEPIQTVPAPRHRSENGNAKAPTPSDFPKVDGDTQKQRDQGRRKILEDELKTEGNALASAKKALAEGEATRLGEERNNYQKYLDRVAKLKEGVTLHEKNIQALEKEIGKTQ